MTNNESKAISLRAAINERAERLRREFSEPLCAMSNTKLMLYGRLQRQIRDLEAELSALPLETEC